MVAHREGDDGDVAFGIFAIARMGEDLIVVTKYYPMTTNER
jgi:hypothetical protein